MNERANEFEKLPSDAVFAWYEVGMEILIWEKLHFCKFDTDTYIYICIFWSIPAFYTIFLFKNFKIDARYFDFSMFGIQIINGK